MGSYEEVDLDQVKVVDNDKLKFSNENESFRVTMLKNGNNKPRIFKTTYLSVNASNNGKDIFFTTRKDNLSPQMIEALKPYSKEETRYLIPLLVYLTDARGQYMNSISLKPLIISDNKIVLFQQAGRNFDLTKSDIILQQQGTLKFQGFQVMPVPDRWVDVNTEIHKEALELVKSFDADKMIDYHFKPYTDEEVISKFRDDLGIILPVQCAPQNAPAPQNEVPMAEDELPPI